MVGQRHARVCVVGLLVLALSLPGASREREEGGGEKQVARLVWPLPPERPRIEHIGSVGARSDRRGGAPSGSWFGRLFLGRKFEGMLRPVAVATDGASLLVVADPGVPTLHFFDIEKDRYRRLKEKVAGRLGSPVGVAVGPSGRIYVSDSVRGRVFVLADSRKVLEEWGEGVLTRPTGLAVDAARKRLYVVDTVACEVFLFDLDGTVVGSFGGRGGEPGKLNYPTYAAVTPEGDLVVSDSLNFRVVVFRPDGTVRTTFGQAGDAMGDFTRPKGVGVDSEGRIYVSDAAFEIVQIFSPEGELLLTFGAPGTGRGEFTLPVGVHVDARNRVWVADSFNKRVQLFRLLEETP